MMALFLLCTAQVFTQVARTGVITELTGTVEVKGANQRSFYPAKMGDPLTMDTMVSTGFRSTALITVGSSVLTVRPLTRLSLAEISAAENTETINVNLQSGRVRVDVKPPAGRQTFMSVQSPSATASVRGTSFEFDTQTLTVMEGTVAFQGSHGKVILVTAGNTSEINADGKAEDTNTAELMFPPLAGSASSPRHSKASGNSVLVGGFRFTVK